MSRVGGREVLTVSEARQRLSRLLAELTAAGPKAKPVLIGARRKPQGVLLSVEAFECLAAIRGKAGLPGRSDVPAPQHSGD